MAEIIYLTEEVSDNVILASKDGEPMIGLGRTNNSIRRALEHHNRDSKATAGVNFIDEKDFENDGYTSNYVESKLHNAFITLGFRRVDRESHFIDKILKKSKTEVFTGKSKKEIKDLINVGDTLSKNFIWNLCKYILDNPNLFKIDFKPRFNQILITNKFLDVIDNKGLSSKILSELCARFGKTTTYLYLLLKMNEIHGTRVMILPGYIHSAFSSFKKEIDLYNDFNNIVYIDTKKDNYEILAKHLDTIIEVVQPKIIFVFNGTLAKLLKVNNFFSSENLHEDLGCYFYKDIPVVLANQLSGGSTSSLYREMLIWNTKRILNKK